MTIDPNNLPYRPCVGVMLLNADGLAFAGQRRDSEVPAWQMPQGGIDPGEDAVTAGFRELEEETGIPAHMASLIAQSSAPVHYDLPPHLLGKVWKGRFRGQVQDWLLLRFNGTDADVNIATEHPEFSEWRWIAPKDLPAQIVPFKRAVYEAVLEQFAEHL
ncbi:RNA pyrophosphohydrolase [Alphaproteobacteria bacterium KMM 3653]|uniref:RNA pyrophosphohydrolase n=1 Tax=Harenicola maris TaxID=2841044 RepID=A0AAP2G7M8_9RHOB|nr:RNA pyrophosphohydrolase [Harenicola maris]